MIKFDRVSKSYPNGTDALNKVDITINDGEFVFIVGPSGAGKSTLLKLLTKEESPTDGEITVGDFNLNSLKKRQIPKLRRSMGFVFQDFRLISDMTVFENVAFAMQIVGASRSEIKKRVPYILELVEMTDKIHAFPNELSGGQQQRVSLARALVNNPDIIIADEPTANVDWAMSREIMGLLDEINKRGTTVIVVTHEKNLVNALQKRVIYLKDGEVESDTGEGKRNV